MTTEKTARDPSVPRWVTKFQKDDEHFDKVSSLSKRSPTLMTIQGKHELNFRDLAAGEHQRKKL